MAKDWYTPDELEELNKLKPCPRWQRMNPTGWCVEKWWAGGPFATLISGIYLAVGMAVLGTVLIYASRVELLKPAIEFFQKSRGHVKQLVANKRSWRAGRRRRRRR